MKDLKIAIISDIHGNLEALLAVLKDIKLQGVDQVFCLGDIIGYGPLPKECLEAVIMMTRKQDIIIGNHESYLFDLELAEKIIRSDVVSGIRFSEKQLLKKDIQFLRSLPYKLILKDLNVTLAHGSFSGQGAGYHILPYDAEAVYEIKIIPTDICFLGHTHIPYLFNLTGGWREVEIEGVELKKKEKYLINVGSVGQSRDLDCRASYGILEYRKRKRFFSIRRVSYDINKTQKSFQNADLPKSFSVRLSKGK